jgi:hypothetical protein
MMRGFLIPTACLRRTYYRACSLSFATVSATEKSIAGECRRRGLKSSPIPKPTGPDPLGFMAANDLAQAIVEIVNHQHLRN